LKRLKADSNVLQGSVATHYCKFIFEGDKKLAGTVNAMRVVILCIVSVSQHYNGCHSTDRLVWTTKWFDSASQYQGL